jgi:hypothetical protein
MLLLAKARAAWSVGVRQLACWDPGFESRWRHGCLPIAVVVCCQVEVSASGRTLVQKSPTECGVYECDHEASTMRMPYLTRDSRTLKRVRSNKMLSRLNTLLSTGCSKIGYCLCICGTDSVTRYTQGDVFWTAKCQTWTRTVKQGLRRNVSRPSCWRNGIILTLVGGTVGNLETLPAY